MKLQTLEVRPAPFLKSSVGTPKIMRDVVLALLPPLAVGVWNFGLQALLVVAGAVLGAVLTEWVASRPRGATLFDYTAPLTGLILGLTLPPGLPVWMAVLGGFVAIALGKLVWGGLGQNLFNPALVGRAFLQAAFPSALTTWAKPGQGFLELSPATLVAPFMNPQVDAITGATPLGLMKFEHRATPLFDLLIGDTGGSIGETSAVLILLGGLYLLARRAFDWRIPASILLTVAVLSTVVWAFAPDRYPDGLHMVLSGGLMFGAVFMATDPVTSPMTPRGAWVFGLGVGVLVVLIRLWGGLPEGVMYAILLMNGATPLINRFLPTRPFGRGRKP